MNTFLEAKPRYKVFSTQAEYGVLMLHGYTAGPNLSSILLDKPLRVKTKLGYCMEFRSSTESQLPGDGPMRWANIAFWACALRRTRSASAALAPLKAGVTLTPAAGGDLPIKKPVESRERKWRLRPPGNRLSRRRRRRRQSRERGAAAAAECPFFTGIFGLWWKQL